MKHYDQCTYFWSGPFSQWAKSQFVIDGQNFKSAEQYMMYKKALVFNDGAIAVQILNTDNPRIQKELGRKVANFNADVWNAVAKDVVFRGSVAKYTQNDEFYTELFSTMGTLIVEASPHDRIWGIGLDEEAAKKVSRAEWNGTNWLGEILTEVRDQIC